MTEDAFSALTLLVAVLEQVLQEMEAVLPRPDSLIAKLEQSRIEAIELAHSLKLAA